MIRYPAVAGQFYPEGETLVEMLEEFFRDLGEQGNSRKITAGVAPHAGYVFSGYTASRTYKAIYEDGLPETFVIFGPNHTGLGSPIAVYPEGDWVTPLGKVKIDSELAKEIVKLSKIADLDDLAHKYEHSIEVQLPFIQYIAEKAGTDFRIVPITLGIQDEDVSEALGRAVFEAAEALGRDVIVIASTDFMHYGSFYGYVPFRGRANELPNMVKEWDMRIIRRILDFDLKGMFEEIREMDHTMCGPGGVGAGIVYSRLMNAREAELLHYTTSFEVSRSTDAIVGYASIVMRR
ncbi:MEMO1 family protein [Pyrococcus abyssi]|uniref:MEMO1 family protein PYRAB05390 n=1 Tax=Pyrococcus abyssi (strain GE5 / Orsay) TaxID=272844 RepID=Y539_PYRAB|nr:MEMO1 family protein [Pyrococcus abyssi]Q9V189.1 RecName: Full=MEMO1 family protein PYRAB05390 [Pyrococcus abyssi GE5]CAB49461.1 Predicted dioxygenase [Pyrococcus abyssi GE5]CCE69928.1 TPA: Dioxygenase [Pyrococcus abyssi GE5]